QQDVLRHPRELVPVVAARRQAAAAVRAERIEVRLVHRLPAADEVAERVRDEVDVPAPVLRAVALDQERALRREPAGQGGVVQARPRGRAGVARGGEHRAVVRDGGAIVRTFLGLEPRPFDGQSVVGQAELGQEREVLGVAARETVPIAGERRAARAFPVPPVRRRRRALALRRRRARAPEKAARPAHFGQTTTPPGPKCTNAAFYIRGAPRHLPALRDTPNAGGTWVALFFRMTVSFPSLEAIPVPSGIDVFREVRIFAELTRGALHAP